MRGLTIYIGPVAEIIVDDTIKKNGFTDSKMAPTTYLRFLEALYQELPADIDRKSLCFKIRGTILNSYLRKGSERTFFREQQLAGIKKPDRE